MVKPKFTCCVNSSFKKMQNEIALFLFLTCGESFLIMLTNPYLNNQYQLFSSFLQLILKEYYDIVNEARHLSGFFPTHADLFYRNAFIIMKLRHLPSFRAIRATIVASQSTFEK